MRGYSLDRRCPAHAAATGSSGWSQPQSPSRSSSGPAGRSPSAAGRSRPASMRCHTAPTVGRIVDASRYVRYGAGPDTAIEGAGGIAGDIGADDMRPVPAGGGTDERSEDSCRGRGGSRGASSSPPPTDRRRAGQPGSGSGPRSRSGARPDGTVGALPVRAAAAPCAGMAGRFDTHCHPHQARCASDPGTEFAQVRAAGVTRFVAVGGDAASNRAAVERAAAHPEVHAAVGVDPQAGARTHARTHRRPPANTTVLPNRNTPSNAVSRRRCGRGTRGCGRGLGRAVTRW